MLYKALGWTVWKLLRLYLRRRYGLVVTRRRVLVASGAVLAAGVVAVGVKAARE